MWSAWQTTHHYQPPRGSFEDTCCFCPHQHLPLTATSCHHLWGKLSQKKTQFVFICKENFKKCTRERANDSFSWLVYLLPIYSRCLHEQIIVWMIQAEVLFWLYCLWVSETISYSLAPLVLDIMLKLTKCLFLLLLLMHNCVRTWKMTYTIKPSCKGFTHS